MTLAKYKTQRRNANRHTPRGLGMLRDSIGKDGWIGAVTVAADGETFDGSARLETLADAMPDTDPIVVHTDGNTPVVVVRDDIPDTDDPRAKRLGVAANRIQQVDYDPDPDVLKELAGEIDLTQFYREDEFARLMGEKPEIDVNGMWGGMPEFSQADLTAFRSLRLNFKSQEDVDAFSKLIGQKILEKTRSIWYPQAEIGRYADKRYSDES